MFSAGTTNTREMQLKFPIFGGKPFIKFQYAVIASWMPPTAEDPGPSDFPLEANCPEASALRIDTSESTMYWTPTKEGGNLVMKVDIFDWQGENNIKGQVSKIVVESPVLSAPYSVNTPNMSQPSGSPFATWNATIPATALESDGTFDVWVIVESANPTTYNHGGPGPWPEDKKLAAINYSTVEVSDTAPPEPPQIISGVDIKSGTTLCPSRTTDNEAVFEVIVVSDFDLTYSWSINQVGEIDNIPGYDNVPGNGDGTLDVDFTAPVFADLRYAIIVRCTVEDGVYPPVEASVLELNLDCIFYHADLADEMWKDNVFWFPSDMAGETMWNAINSTDASGKLSGTGALWQSASGDVTPNSKGLLLSGPMFLPDFLSSAKIYVEHSYYFSPLNNGGNIKLGQPGTLQNVTAQPITISSGHGYDGDLADNTNVMYPQPVFSDDTEQLVLSIVNIPSVFIGAPFQFGFGAASGEDGGTMAGGWMIDDVKIIGTL